MKTKLIVDERVCTKVKYKMSLEEVLLALVIRRTSKYEELLDNMLKREIIVKQGDTYFVTQPWNDKVDEILCDSQGPIGKEEELLEFAEKLRQVFPEGRQKRRPNSTGTLYHYRCNRGEVVQALKRFFVTFGSDYTFDEILDAAKRYVASFKGTYDNMRIIKYFIIKDETNKGGDIISDLATYLDNKDDNVENDVPDDWTTTII